MAQRHSLTLTDDDVDSPNLRSSRQNRSISDVGTRRPAQRQSSNESINDLIDFEVVDASNGSVIDSAPRGRYGRSPQRYCQTGTSGRTPSPLPIRREHNGHIDSRYSEHASFYDERSPGRSREQLLNRYSHSPSPPNQINADMEYGRHHNRQLRQNDFRSRTDNCVPRQDSNTKEWEVRRYSGKDDIEEYLIQFDITARHNGWTTSRKAMALLHALDGPARGIYHELEDPVDASFGDIKRALLRRFGHGDNLDVHERALARLRLGTGQNIRELAQEVAKLTKLAYPDIGQRSRERFAIKHLLQAIGDRDVVFYIKDKDPSTVGEACSLYERFLAFNDIGRRGQGARSIRLPSETDTNDQVKHINYAHMSSVDDKLKHLTDLVYDLKRQQSDKPSDQCLVNNQLKQLTEAVQSLNCTAKSSVTGEIAPSFKNPTVPKKPCPNCKKPGHWKRDCPVQRRATGRCFECDQEGHRWRQCPSLGNGNRSSLAPNDRPTAEEQPM